MTTSKDGSASLGVELAVIAAIVSASVTGVAYAVASPAFDHPVDVRAESAWSNFATASVVLSLLGTAAAWVAWLRLRRRAHLDVQPDGPARLLAVGVAILPDDRREWGSAMSAELASVGDRGERWRFAASGASAALRSPEGWQRPAAGWVGAMIGAVGVMACVAATVHMLAVEAATADVTPVYVVVTLVIGLAACLAVLVAAPPAMTSSRLARRIGVSLGLGSGVALLLLSRSGALEAGALLVIGPAQLLAFVVAPAVVAGIARSLGAALQCILWGFVFSVITMFPAYIIESIRRYRTDGELYLDADAPAFSTVSDNLTDAVSWLVLVVPLLLIPIGVLTAALVATIACSVARADA